MKKPIAYAILDSNGRCVNRVLWNGDESAWQPPSGCQAVPDLDNKYSIYREPQNPVELDPLASLTQEQKLALIKLLEAETFPKPLGWDPPQEPTRYQLYQAPDNSLWRWDQPRNANGQYVADDPSTTKIESALRWIPVKQ